MASVHPLTTLKNYATVNLQNRASNVDPELVQNCGSSADMAWNCDVTISGTFKILIERTGQRGKKKKYLEFWHNTLFVDAKTGDVDFG